MHASAILIVRTNHMKGGGVIGLSLHAVDGIMRVEEGDRPNSKQHRKAKPKTAMARLKSITLIGWEDSGRGDGLPVGDVLRRRRRPRTVLKNVANPKNRITGRGK